MAILGSIGRYIVAVLRFTGGVFVLLVDALGCILRGRVSARLCFQQIAILGGDSLPIALVTLTFAGMVLSLHTAKLLVQFEAASFVGGMVAVSVARELGPVLTSIIVAARVGSAMAAEVGTMKITEQIDALRALATSPTEYLVVPRLVAGVVALPLLTVFTDAAGGAGAFAVATFHGVTSSEYVESVRRWMDMVDLVGGLAKTTVFGLIIALVGCRMGLTAAGGAAGVGRVTTRAVVTSIVLIYLANYFLSSLILTIWP